MSDGIIDEEDTIYYLLFPDDFAIITGEKDVHSIRAYGEPSHYCDTAWFIVCDINGNILMRINSAYVQIIGYQPLPNDDYAHLNQARWFPEEE